MADSMERADGFTTQLGGMDGGRNAQLINVNAYSKGVNVVVRDGFVTSRPGFASVASISGSKFQGAGRWSLDSVDRLVLVVDGHVHVVNCDTSVVQDMGLLFDPDDLCYFCQPDRWLLIQNGTDRPVVLQDVAGVVSVYGRNPPEVRFVPGTICHYAHSRVHYVPTFVPEQVDSSGDGMPDSSTQPGGMVFVSGDVRNILNPEYLFRMDEHLEPLEGGGLGLPGELGFITAMSTLRNAASGTGVGALIVFGREGVSAFAVDTPRDQWLTTSIAQALFIGGSTRSANAVVSVNGDLVFVDSDGFIRSLGYTEYERQRQLTNRPMSFEITPFINTTNVELASLSHADNRILATVNGFENHFRGLASADLAPDFTLAAQGMSVAYDGMWTGFKFRQIIGARHLDTLCHWAIVESDSGFRVLIHDKTTVNDVGSTVIESQLTTRSFNFQAPADPKLLKYVELRLGDMVENVTCSVYYRPSGYPLWLQMGSAKTINVPTGSPAQARRRLRFALDPDSALCDTVTDEKLCVGDGFQIRVVWTGHAAIERMRVVGELLVDAPPACDEDNPDDEYPTAGVVENDFSYEVALA